MFYLLYEPVCIYIICSYWYTGRSYYWNCMYHRSISHAYTYIYILRCSTHPFVQRESILAWLFSTLQIYDMIYVYITCVYCIYIYTYLHDLLSVTGMVYTTSGRLVIVWRQWISSPGAFGWLSNGPDGYGLEVGFPFQHLGRFWWKRWMLDVEIEDNLGIFLSTPLKFSEVLRYYTREWIGW